MWINIISIIVIAILAFQMYACYFNPSLAYGKFENNDANLQAILTLAGRNFVMIVVTLLALKSQNAMFLAFTFIMNFAREIYDMVLVGYLDHFSLKGIGMMATFLVFLIPYIFALKKKRQLASKND
ncbi:MAG: hypothetical protein FJ264_16260 [Planctomycetes bacterium]|nr:hypothetical protein [Planctomycetota bacterium]